jgi:hypothetical protein
MALPLGNNCLEMAGRSGGSALITKETYERLERAREALAPPGGDAPHWYQLAAEHGFSRPTVTKIKQAGTGTKKNIELQTAAKLARALRSTVAELFLVDDGSTKERMQRKNDAGERELNELIDEAFTPGRHIYSDGEAVKELARTVTIHPVGHAGGADLVRALLDVASILRLAGDGPATPEKMMRQIARQVAATHPLEGVRTPEQAIGELVKSGKGKSGPISKPKIPVAPKRPPEK